MPSLLLLLLVEAHAAPDSLVVVDALPTTLLPLYARTEADHRTAALLFEPLFYRSALGSQLESVLVDRYTLETDAAQPSITVHLDGKVRWADGHVLDGEDVCFTIEALLDGSNPVPESEDHRSRVAGCTVAESGSAATVHFRRTVPDPRDWLQLSVLPAHAFESPVIPPDHPFSHTAFGSKGRTAVLHPDRVAITAEKSRSLPRRIEVRPRVEETSSGPVLEVRVPIDAAAKPPHTPPDTLRPFDSRTLWWVAIRHAGPLANAETRRALDAALDRAALIQAVWSAEPTAPTPVTGPFLATSPFADRSVMPPPPSTPAPDTVPALRMGVRASDAAQVPGLAPAIVAQLGERGIPVTLVALPEASISPPDDLDLLLMHWMPPPTDHPDSVLRPDGAHNPFHTTDLRALELLTTMDEAATATDEVAAARALHTWLHTSTYALWLSHDQTRSRWPAELPRTPITPGSYWTELR